MDYATSIYVQAPPSLLHKLDVIHNILAQIFLSAFGSTPTLAWQNELMMRPIYLQRQYLAAKALT